MTTPPIPWRMRRLVLRAAVLTFATGRHHYVSTGCLHDDTAQLAGKPVNGHDHCRCRETFDGASKTPGTCKFCPATCMCTDCDHGADATAPDR